MKNTKQTRFVPVEMTKNDVRRTYARLSRVYDFWVFITESKAVDRALNIAEIHNGESILEVAVGTGQVFERIVSLNSTGRNEGIDISREMLARAAKRLIKHYSNFSLKVADAYSLPYPDSTFNLIINNYMFDLLPEQDFPIVLQEFKRVLKSGGRVVITSMAPGRKWYNRIWDRLIRAFPNALEGCRPITLEEDFKQADFKNIRSEYVSQFTFPSMVFYAEKPR